MRPLAHGQSPAWWRFLLPVALAATTAAQADTGGATVAEFAPINDLLDRARDGARRGDWKFVVDSLQRVIDDPQGALTTVDGEIYESARMQAYRQLAALPQAGADTYHLLYDGEAAQLYEHAVEAYDFVKLQRVVDRYLLADAGARAALTLAGWFIDLAKPEAAITILTDVVNLRGADPQLTSTCSAMLAVAYAQLHRGAEARRYLDAARGGPASPQEQRRRVERIASFLAGQAPQVGSGDPRDSWAMMYGNSARTGQMPATRPVLLEGLPWRHELTLKSPPLWSAVIDHQTRSNLLLTSQMVADRDRLYLKAGGQIVALDLLNFEVDWVAQKPPSSATQRALNRINRLDPWNNSRSDNAATEESRLVNSVVQDDVGAQVSLAHGLLFDILGGDAEDDGGLWRIGRNLPRMFGGRRTQRSPNTLIARDPARGGEIKWSLGIEGVRPPHPMIFASTPIAVGGHLLIIYWNGQDLYAGLLDPADGNKLRSIYLCTMGEDLLDTPDILLPAVDDQFAYIPTNSGLLLALNLGDFSLRWASRYERSDAPAGPVGRRRNPPGIASRTRDQQRRWLVGPPVVAGATVLLAPTDGDQLFAFDHAGGRTLWNKPHDEHSYIIAADHTNLWLGGKYLAMVSVSSGKSIWRIESGSATGRAVLSGDRILLPTRDSLAVFAADSGERIETQPLPADHAPLGKLLCWDGALYSLDSQQVRKFPDLEQSYEPAKRMHAAAPTDPTAAIRLAWLELLRHQPEEVLAALEHVALSEAPSDQRQALAVAHLRVKALLAGTELLDLSGAEAEERLVRACEIARSAEDQFQATIALADLLTRHRRSAEAYERVWRLAQANRMGEPTELSPAWKRSKRSVLFDKLSEINRTLPDSQQQTVAEHLGSETALDTVPTRRTRRALQSKWDRLAEGDGLHNWDQSAAMSLGRLYVGRKKYEKADYYFRRAGRLTGTLARPAAALYELARMYSEQSSESAALALPEIERLRSGFADAEIDEEPVEQLVARLEERVERQQREIRRRFAAFVGGLDLDPPFTSVLPGSLVQFQRSAPSGLTDLLLVLEQADRLVAYRPSDGRRLWPVDLRLEDESSLPEIASRPLSSLRRSAQARTEGQVLIVNTQTGLHAIGLITGRRLWSIPIDVPEPHDRHIADGDLFDLKDGRVALRAHAHQLDLVRSVDGNDKLWSVQLPDYIIGSVHIAKDRVVVFDHSGLTAIAFDLHTGRRLFQKSFTQVREGSTKHILLIDGILCGTEGNALVGYSLDDGRQEWTAPIQLPITSLFAASSDCVVVGGRGGRCLAVRPENGRTIYEGRIPFAPSGIYAGHDQSETLYLIGLGEEADGHEVQLAAVDLAKRRVLWTRTDLSVPVCGQWSLEALADRIALVYASPEQSRAKAPSFLDVYSTALVLLDKRTGELAAEPLPLAIKDGLTTPAGEIQFWPNRVVIGTTGGVNILPLELQRVRSSRSG